MYSDNVKQRIPLADVYSVVIDNRASLISVGLLSELADSNIHVIICDNKHNPNSVFLSMNTHYKPLGVIKKQFSLSEELKSKLWQRIVKQKIANQVKCLRLAGVNKKEIETIELMCAEVLPDDKTNREAAAARHYFLALFGCVFKRTNDDVTNAALNYGYAIIRSAVAKTLVAYGYNCVIGLHHSNDYNAFNLADDMMEPLRTLVDLWVDSKEIIEL